MIFKKSPDEGVVPFDWRAANVVLISSRAN